MKSFSFVGFCKPKSNSCSCAFAVMGNTLRVCFRCLYNGTGYEKKIARIMKSVLNKKGRREDTSNDNVESHSALFSRTLSGMLGAVPRASQVASWVVSLGEPRFHAIEQKPFRSTVYRSLNVTEKASGPSQVADPSAVTTTKKLEKDMAGLLALGSVDFLKPKTQAAVIPEALTQGPDYSRPPLAPQASNVATSLPQLRAKEISNVSFVSWACTPNAALT
jgi:hypothetical protein